MGDSIKKILNAAMVYQGWTLPVKMKQTGAVLSQPLEPE